MTGRSRMGYASLNKTEKAGERREIKHAKEGKAACKKAMMHFDAVISNSESELRKGTHHQKGTHHRKAGHGSKTTHHRTAHRTYRR